MYNHNYKNLTGKTFGYLTVIKESNEQRKPYHRKYKHWECLCVCGNHKVVSEACLENGIVKTCGCRRRKDMPAPRQKALRDKTLSKTYQRNVEIKTLVNKGITLRKIAEQYNISFQRVYQIYKATP